MTVKFYSESEGTWKTPPLDFSSLWKALNHVEAHQETGRIEIEYEKQGRIITEALNFETGHLIRGWTIGSRLVTDSMVPSIRRRVAKEQAVPGGSQLKGPSQVRPRPR
jgi:hypothetical protein